MSMALDQFGLRMPAEWEPHEATWIAWPHRRDDWPGKFAPIPWVYAEIVRQLHASERVRILVNDERMEQRARQILRKTGVDLTCIDFFHIATDRVWTRDYGPMFVTMADGAPAIVDWQFNAWAKYPDWQFDNAVARQVSDALAIPRREPMAGHRQIVLEGGSIDVNGQGLLLTTEECLLSPVQQRNPGLTQKELEEAFATYLGVHKTLWLGRGIAGDDTHGHIDDLARFVSPWTIVAVVENNHSDENYKPLQENWERLQRMTGLNGESLEVVALPMPSPVVFDGQRLPASYANFYMANDQVLVPTFNDPQDRRALDILVNLFPDRKVSGIHAVDLVWGLGTLHCMSQQQPAFKKRRS
jgi:agmatine deiminase